MNMQPVTDGLRVHIVTVENRPSDPGLAMVERTHGIEEVGRASRTGGHCCKGLGWGVVARSHSHTHPAGCGMFDHLQHMRKAGREVHQSNLSARRLLESLEEFDP